MSNSDKRDSDSDKRASDSEQGSAPTPGATFVICEDGREYLDRFERAFGAAFRFVRAGDVAEARAALAAGAVAAVLLDLDFRRTPGEALIDEGGASGAPRPDSERRRLAATQGILILRALRVSGVTCPALLFADLDDPGQVAFLESSLAPLSVVPSSAGARDLARRLEDLARPLPARAAAT